MKISEITRPVNIDAAADRLGQGGYSDIGREIGHTHGAFSTVMYRPDSPFLVKLFMPSDTAYLRFLKLITSVQNPHFPVVRGRPVQVNEKYYAVRLERLSPMPQSGDMASLRYHMEGYLQYLQLRKQTSHMDEWIPESIRNALQLVYQYCLKGHPETVVDLHQHNVMLRGSVPVIIDPTSD